MYNGTVLQEAESSVDLLVVGHNDTHEDIRVAVEVLGSRVDDDISSEL